MRAVLRVGLVLLLATPCVSCAARKAAQAKAPTPSSAPAESTGTALPTGWTVTDWDTVELSLKEGGEVSVPMWVATNPDQPEVVYVNFTWADRRSGWSIAPPGAPVPP